MTKQAKKMDPAKTACSIDDLIMSMLNMTLDEEDEEDVEQTIQLPVKKEPFQFKVHQPYTFYEYGCSDFTYLCQRGVITRGCNTCHHQVHYGCPIHELQSKRPTRLYWKLYWE